MPPKLARWDQQHTLASQLLATANKLMNAGGGGGGRSPPQQQGWQCRRSDCLYAVKGYLNRPERTVCHCCTRPKAQCLSPPAYACVEPLNVVGQGARLPQSEVIAKDDAQTFRVKEARSRKRAARLARKKAMSKTGADAGAERRAEDLPDDRPGPVAVEMAKTQVQEVRAPPKHTLDLSEEVLKKVPSLLKNAVQTIQDSLALEHVPSEPDNTTPEEVIARLLGHRGPTAKVANKARLEAELCALKSSLVTLTTAGVSGTALKALEEDIKASEAALLKASKEVPSSTHELKALAGTKSEYEVEMQARKDRGEKGAAKTAARVKERHAYIQTLREEVDALEAAVLHVEMENAHRFAAKTKATLELDKGVLELLEKKVQDITNASAAPQGAPPAMPAGQQPAAGPGGVANAPALALVGPNGPAPAQSPATVKPPEMLALDAQKEELARQVSQLQQAFKDAQAALDQQARFEVSVEGATVEQFRPISCEGMVEEHVRSLGLAWWFLAQWHDAGASIPFTVEHAARNLGITPEEVLNVLNEALDGRADEWKVTLGSTVPRQCCLLAHQNLGRFKEKYGQEQVSIEDRKAATDAYAAVAAEVTAKKRKLASD